MPDNLLPALKATFLLYVQGNRAELLKHIEERAVPAGMRKDPTIENFEQELKDFATKAKKNP